VSQCAILGIDSSMGVITKFLCQLNRRNSVVGRAHEAQEEYTKIYKPPERVELDLAGGNGVALIGGKWWKINRKLEIL